MSSSAYPFITVILPLRNEEAHIERTLRQILSQEYPPDRYEIIVADGRSTDRTREIVLRLAQEHPQIILLDNPNLLSSSARNLGFRKGRGDYFLVIDGHCWIPSARLLQDMSNLFQETGADVLCRPQPLSAPGLNVFQKAVALARSSPLGHARDSLIYSQFEGYCNPVSSGAAYSRRVLEIIGFVDETFDACEDVEFNYRISKAGLRSYMSPKLTILYYPRATPLAFLKQMIRYGRGRAKFARKHPETAGFGVLAPLFFCTALIVLCTTPMKIPALMPLTATVLFLYFTVIGVEGLRLAHSSGPRLILLTSFALAMIHTGLGIGLAIGFAQALRQTITTSCYKATP